jgi:AraC-like DNA-binding protein
MKRTSSSFWVKGLVDMFASQGINTSRLLLASNIQAQDLLNPSARFGVDQISKLWNLAVEWSGNQALGLDVQLAGRFGCFDAVAHVMISSTTLACAMDNLGRYLVLISDATTYARRVENGDSWVSLGHSGNVLRIPPQRTAYGMVLLLALSRWLTHVQVQPRAVHFEFAEPADLRPYRAAFQCDIRFGQPRTELLFSAQDMALLLPTRNQALLELHARYMQEQINVLIDAPASRRVREEVSRCIEKGEPLRHVIAGKLSISDRTLQRRLQAENTSFQQLLDSVRIELTKKYLADERCSLQEIASSLGFVDDSNFYRACKRWFGVSPGQYRKNLALQYQEESRARALHMAPT